MFNIKRVVYTVILCLALCVSLFSIGCRQKKVPSGPIRIGYIKVSSCLPFFVALEKGYFGNEGVTVEPVLFANSNEGTNALVANKVDGIVGFGLSTLFSVETVSPGQFKVYMPCVETSDNFVNWLLLRPDSTLKSIADLKGKKVGTYEGASLLKVLKLLLKKFMDPDRDVTIVQVPKSAQIQGLVARQYDALFTIEPYATIALAEGYAKPLEENPRVKYLLDPFPAGANAFSVSFMEDSPAQIKSIYRALKKANNFIRENPAAAKATLPKYMPLSPEVAAKTGIYRWWNAEELDMKAVQKYADLMTELGILQKPMNVSLLFLVRAKLE